MSSSSSSSTSSDSDSLSSGSSSGPSVWENGVETFIRERRGPSPGLYKDDVGRSRFPFAITWTPLPCISWFLPFIGHMGLCDSRGVVYDFAGPYHIGADDMAFGQPTRVLTLDPERVGRTEAGRSKVQIFDAGVDAGCDEYKGRMHNICCDNCHSHVARCLNEMRYGGRTDWNMVTLCFWILFSGRWVSFGRAVTSWLPFVIILTGVILLARFAK